MSRRLTIVLVVALALSVSSAWADWTASGLVQYRDREFDGTGFTGSEPLLPARFADVEVIDLAGPSVLATGVTDDQGAFSIAVIDAQMRDVEVRILTRGNYTPDLFLEVTDASFEPYAIVSPPALFHPPANDIDFGTLSAEIGQGGEPFNLWDMGVYASDYMAFLMGSRPGSADSLRIVWESARGQGASTASSTRLDVRDTGAYDDTVMLHEYAHFIVFNYSDSDNPTGAHGFAECDQDPRLSWEEGHATFFGCAIRKHFGLPRPHIYVRTTGQPGPGGVSLYTDLETETEFQCSGNAGEVAIFTALWDVFDGPAVQDFTPGIDDGPVDVLELSDQEHWEVMTNGLPGRLEITSEDYWDAWFEAPIQNGFLPEMISIWSDGVEIRYFEDGDEPNDVLAEAIPWVLDGSGRPMTFFSDPDADGSGGSLVDTDWFSFDALAGLTYEFETLNLLSGADTRINLRDNGGSLQASNDDRVGGDPSSFVSWTAPADGTYFLEVIEAASDTTIYGSFDLLGTPPPDGDGDGVADAIDVCPALPDPGQEDGDGDGVGDACDNCPALANPGQENNDGDANGNACDACPDDPDDDADGDGLCGDVDNCPGIANPGQEDEDIDGLGDACDPCPGDTINDDDADGICGVNDICPFEFDPGQEDSDLDGAGDACDVCPNDADDDLDADGVCGDVDNCPAVANPGQGDADADGIGDDCETDDDDDGIEDSLDNCPLIANPGQEDQDTDGIGDACDADLDGDGQDNDVDNCPTVVNAGQSDIDNDGLGNVCDPDDDNDGILDGDDNCQLYFNPGQSDIDGDGLGELCDDDDDDDGFIDVDDNCPLIANAGQEDEDGDGIGDFCDACLGDDINDVDTDGLCAIVDNCPTVANPGQQDTNADGIGDACRIVTVVGTTNTFVIATTEVTNAQYAALLNAVAFSDPNQLYHLSMGSDSRGGIERTGSDGSFSYTTRPEMDDKPVNFVSWEDAARYVNWRHNGSRAAAQTSATTEDGAYDMSIPDPGGDAFREPGARWFLPTRAEWSDTAYLDPADPGCCNYPTRSNTAPAQSLADAFGDVTNPGSGVANFGSGADWNGQDGNLTTVAGAGPLGTSPWGTWDQGGNVSEWTETSGSGSKRLTSGGGYGSDISQLAASTNPQTANAEERADLGFRVAGVTGCSDGDGDGAGSASSPGCPVGPFPDCDDSDSTTYPGAPQLCDGVNTDCLDPAWPTPPADELDDDGDLVLNCTDNCPALANPTQTDTDADGQGDLCDTCPNDPGNDADADGFCADVDNCPANANPAQIDADADGLGDPCDTCPNDFDNDADADSFCGDVDNCPTIANPTQADADTDGSGDTCDNCPATVNVDQLDADGDGRGDACDCAPDRSATTSLPERVAELDVSGGAIADLTWSGALEGHVWDLYRGSIPAGGTFALNPACLASGLVAREMQDTTLPAPGELLYYLVAARNGCGDGGVGPGRSINACSPTPGTDTDTDGVPDVDDACPAVADAAQLDADADRVGDACDNCPGDYNPLQLDGDDNGVGNACEP